MAVQFFNEEVPMPKLPKKRLREFIVALAKEHGCSVGEVNYNFCGDEKILQVNNQYLQHDYYTDIITFDYTEEQRIAGDIFISVDTVKSNAQTYNTEFEQELLRIIFHGILHLCGINDKSDEERTEMTRCEEKALVDYVQFNIG